MENNNLEKKLLIIFNNVNEWLKFAETKNGVFIGFIGAILFALLSNWNTLDNETQLASKYVIFPFGIAVLIILSLAFIPQFNVSNKLKKKKKNDQRIKNLFYFKYLRNLTNTELLNKLNKDSESEEPVNYKSIELDLSEQIIVNAYITYKKYILFKGAIIIAIVGLILSLILILILRTQIYAKIF